MSGTFNGGIKKVTYPSGGSITYNYQNKLLFNNTSNRYQFTPNWNIDNYYFSKIKAKDNYAFYVARSKYPINGSMYRYLFYRYTWNGKHWEENVYTFPHLMNSNIDGFQAVFKDNSYAFSIGGSLYLFHLNKDGRTWHEQSYSNIYTGGGILKLFSGNDFFALGAKYSGRLDIFTWNGTNWATKLISQGPGEYFYTSKNNFVLSLNEGESHTESDMITGQIHSDLYYIHYLDAEKKWKTKSWSAAADPYIAAISTPYNGADRPVNVFTSNNIATIVAWGIPETFLRWDTNYNLTQVDNDVLGFHDDNSLMISAKDLYTLTSNGLYQIKTVRFNGINWSVSPNAYQPSKLNLGVDIQTYTEPVNSSSVVGSYNYYNPNSNSWISGNLNYNNSLFGSTGITNNFFVFGNKFYTRSTQGGPVNIFNETQVGAQIQYNNAYIRTDGFNHAYISDNNDINHYYYMDKNTGLINDINLGGKRYFGRGIEKFGGNVPFLSSKTMWLKNIGLATKNWTKR